MGTNCSDIKGYSPRTECKKGSGFLKEVCRSVYDCGYYFNVVLIVLISRIKCDEDPAEAETTSMETFVKLRVNIGAGGMNRNFK